MEFKKRIYKKRRILEKHEITKDKVKDKSKRSMVVKIEESTEFINNIIE